MRRDVVEVVVPQVACPDVAWWRLLDWMIPPRDEVSPVQDYPNLHVRLSRARLFMNISIAAYYSRLGELATQVYETIIQSL